ncbi:MAG: ester cyclase [Thermosynechococcaceae cyanobacterium]
MSQDRNQTQVLQFYQAFDDRNIDQALAMLAPTFVAHMAGMPAPLNAEEFKAFGQTFYNAFSNSKHTFDQVIATDHQVVTCGTFTATHLGSFQGLPPTGKEIQIAIMHIDRLENGHIIEHWGQGDAQGLMQQLGIVFLPGPKLVPAILKNLLSGFGR